MQIFLEDGMGAQGERRKVPTKGTSLEMAADDPQEDYRAFYRKIAESVNISVADIRLIFAGHCFDGSDEGRSMTECRLSEECTVHIVFTNPAAGEAFWAKWCP